MLISDSVQKDGEFSFGYYRDLVSGVRFWPLLGNSVRLAAATTVVCGLIGIPIGVLFAKTDLPLRPVFLWILTVPFVLPPYFMALGWSRLFTSQLLFGIGGCVLVLSSVFLPITILLAAASSSAVDQRLEEAALLVSGWPRILRKITLPLSAPGILFSLVLVFLLSMGEFSVANFLRFPVLPVLSFTQFTASYNFGAATAAAVPLAAIAFIGTLAETGFLKEQVYTFRSTGRALVIPLKRWKHVFIFVLCGLCFGIVILPLYALFADAFSIDALQQAARLGRPSILRSVTYSAAAATMLMCLGFLLGHFMQGRRRQVFNFLTLVLFSIPGTVLSIGLIRLWNTSLTSLIYTTPAVLILGYTAQYCAVSTRLSVAGLLAIPPSFTEAARLSGASWIRRLWRISIPLSRRALICSWLAAYILCLRDVPIALMTAPPGRDPLPARILTMMANGAPPLIASLCLLMTIAALVPLLILGGTLGSQSKRR